MIWTLNLLCVPSRAVMNIPKSPRLGGHWGPTLAAQDAPRYSKTCPVGRKQVASLEGGWCCAAVVFRHPIPAALNVRPVEAQSILQGRLLTFFKQEMMHPASAEELKRVGFCFGYVHCCTHSLARASFTSSSSLSSLSSQQLARSSLSSHLTGFSFHSGMRDTAAAAKAEA